MAERVFCTHCPTHTCARAHTHTQPTSLIEVSFPLALFRTFIYYACRHSTSLPPSPSDSLSFTFIHSLFLLPNLFLFPFLHFSFLLFPSPSLAFSLTILPPPLHLVPIISLSATFLPLFFPTFYIPSIRILMFSSYPRIIYTFFSLPFLNIYPPLSYFPTYTLPHFAIYSPSTLP